jgi:hypothetical protein
VSSSLWQCRLRNKFLLNQKISNDISVDGHGVLVRWLCIGEKIETYGYLSSLAITQGIKHWLNISLEALARQGISSKIKKACRLFLEKSLPRQRLFKEFFVAAIL